MTPPCEQVFISLTTDASDDADADDADDGHTLPSDRELAAYFRETWDADGHDAPTWLEYFGFEDGTSKERRDLDDRVREFMMDHIGPQSDGA